MNKKNLRQEKGITLIALVITIIVMLILVAVTITVAVNGGLFGYARNAAVDTNTRIAEEQNMADLEGGMSVDELIGKYTGNGWKDNGDGTFSNESSTVALGDYINYNCYTGKTLTYKSLEAKNGYGDQTFTVDTNTNIKWRVLGVKNGQLLIVMDTAQMPAEEEYGYYLSSRTGYNNGIAELKEICNIYGQGKHATNVRSITVEDINKITGYNPLTAENGKPYSNGELWQYGNKVKYEMDNGKVKWTSYNVSGKNGVTEDDSVIIKPDGTTVDNLDITVDYYYYNASDIGMNANSEAYKMLFKKGTTNDNDYYWLASSYVDANEGYACWGLRFVYDGLVNGCGLWCSYGDNDGSRCGVRAVVSLASDIKLKAGTAVGEVDAWDFDD